VAATAGETRRPPMRERPVLPRCPAQEETSHGAKRRDDDELPSAFDPLPFESKEAQIASDDSVNA